MGEMPVPRWSCLNTGGMPVPRCRCAVLAPAARTSWTGKCRGKMFRTFGDGFRPGPSGRSCVVWPVGCCGICAAGWWRCIRVGAIGRIVIRRRWRLVRRAVIARCGRRGLWKAGSRRRGLRVVSGRRAVVSRKRRQGQAARIRKKYRRRIRSRWSFRGTASWSR
jgi:hypothetical protein